MIRKTPNNFQNARWSCLPHKKTLRDQVANVLFICNITYNFYFHWPDKSQGHKTFVVLTELKNTSEI